MLILNLKRIGLRHLLQLEIIAHLMLLIGLSLNILYVEILKHLQAEWPKIGSMVRIINEGLIYSVMNKLCYNLCLGNTDLLTKVVYLFKSVPY